MLHAPGESNYARTYLHESSGMHSAQEAVNGAERSLSAPIRSDADASSHAKVKCEMCNGVIEEHETEEGVVRMSECFWHVRCFTCITCGKQVPLEQDSVLLVGTQPMCSACTFNCRACGEVIQDEVVMCECDPYHSDCFCCGRCKLPIDTTVFAHASGMICCAACLEEGEQDSRTDSIPSVSETWRDSLVSRDARSSVDYVNRSPRTDSMFSLNEAQVDQYQRPTCTKPSAAHRALQVSVFWNTSPKKEPSTQSEPPEELSQRLSERIQMDILQAYGSTHSRPETPAQGFYEKGNLLDASAEKEMDAQRSANLRAASLTESEIKRNLSLYEPEFAALLETPEIMRNNRIESEESRMSKLRLSNDAQVFLDHVSDETDGLSSGETRMHMPTDQATDIYSHIPNDMQGLEMHRHVALAELLAIRDTTAPPGAFPGDSMPVQNRVALLLDSLVAHLDSVKQEYVDQLQNLLLMQNTVRQELGPMLEQHAMLQKQNQHMLQKANELAGCVMQLEASRARTEKPLPETHKGAGTFQVSPSLMPKPNVASLQLGSPETRPAPASEPPNSARLDASLPPLPSQRKFRWIKPLLLSNQDLTAIGNTLLQPAYDIGRTSPASLPPSPQRYDVTHTHPHDFQTTNILRPNARCCVCTRNVWAQTELRCTQCLLTCHVGCNDHVTSACEPNRPSAHQRSGSLGKTLMPLHEFTNPPQVESMIGRPLQDQVQREQNAVPRLIDRCLIAIERNGINEEGIYRRTGGINQQKQIVQLFDSGQQFDLCDIRQFNDTGAITSVVKFYLRELPEPLIPSELHDDFVEFGVQLESGSSFPAAPAMAALLGKLPVANRNTLQRLCMHLSLVSENEEQTKMSASNLGLIFGPTLMRASNPGRELVETGTCATVVKCIYHC